jgi:hypothetical protein
MGFGRYPKFELYLMHTYILLGVFDYAFHRHAEEKDRKG